jgi:hypothetical protein
VSGLETAAIALGAAVAKTACGVWLGPVAEVGNSMIDLAARRLATAREQRQFRRVWEQAAELIAEQVEPLVEREFRDVPEHERVAALEAVRDTFDAAGLTEEELLSRISTRDSWIGYFGTPTLTASIAPACPTARADSTISYCTSVVRTRSSWPAHYPGRGWRR